MRTITFLTIASVTTLAGSFFLTSRAVAASPLGVAHCCCSGSGGAIVGVLRARIDGGQECDTNGHDDLTSNCGDADYCVDKDGNHVFPNIACDTLYGATPPVKW